MTDRETDADILVEMLWVVEDGLDKIVHSPRLFLVRFRFGEVVEESVPWRKVAGALEQARKEIRGPNLKWEYVAGVGLVGDELRWKRRLLQTERRHGTVGRFLKLANSFLGSLRKVLPRLEPGKEFK